MTEPTFGYSSAQRDGLLPTSTVEGRKVNLRAQPDVSSPVVAVVSSGAAVYAGNPEDGWVPVRIEGWISSELLK